MTDNLRSMSLRDLQNYDFSQVDLINSQAEASALLAQPGRVSLDDQGRLTLVSPDSKPDRGVVRFFKGLFNAQYRAEQRVLDRVSVLAQNKSFNERVTTSFLQHCDPQTRVANLSRTDKFSVLGLATKAATSKGFDNPVNLTELKNLADATATRFASVLDDASKLAFTKNFANRDIIFQGKAMSVYDFVSQIAPQDPNERKVPDVRSLGAALVKHCAFNPELMKSVLPQEDSVRLRELLGEPKITQNQQTELMQLSQKAITAMTNKLNTMAQAALARGCDPQQTAHILNDALWTIGRGNARNIESGIFDASKSSSIAARLAALPGGGTEASTISADTRAQLDAVKAHFPDLDDAQAAKINAFCDTCQLSVDKYAEFATTFKEAAFAMVCFGALPSNYEAYRDASDKLQQALADFSARQKTIGGDDFSMIGGVPIFHAQITGEKIDFVEGMLKNGPDLKESLTEVVFNPDQVALYDQINPQSSHNLSSLLNVFSAALMSASLAADGTDGASHTRSRVDNVLSLAFMDDIKQPRVQGLLNQMVADVEPKYQDGLRKYLEAKLMDQVSDSHHPVRTESLPGLKQKALADSKFMSLLNAQPDPLSAEKEAQIRNFLSEDPVWGIANSLKDSLAKSNDFDAYGFHNVFDVDTRRYLFTELNGKPAGNDPAQIRAEFASIVPQDFIPAVSALCMQGGLLASLSNIVTLPEVVGDNDRYDLATLASTYKAAVKTGHSSQLRREDNILFLNTQIELTASSHQGGEPYGRYNLSIEVAINLNGGIDENGVPNSISIINIGQDRLRR